MTKEETIQALRDGLEAVGIDSPLRLTLVNAIEHLSATTEDGVKGAYIRRNRYTKKNVLNGFDVTCDAVQKFKEGDRVKIIIVKEV